MIMIPSIDNQGGETRLKNERETSVYFSDSQPENDDDCCTRSLRYGKQSIMFCRNFVVIMAKSHEI